jgi:creatinine amidohydrolase
MSSTTLDIQASTFRLRDARPLLAILPVAALEQHGTHLPVATDWIILEEIARRVAAEVPSSYVLPALPFGTSLAHLGTAGTVGLTWPTLLHVVRDLVESLLVQGIRQVVVLNNLGEISGSTVQPRGNFIVKTAVRQLNYANPTLDTLWVQPLAVASKQLSSVFESGADDVQAGEVETSLMLAVRPDLVRDGAVDHVPALNRQFAEWAPFNACAPGGVWGRPSLASRAKGERALELAVHATVEYINESFACLATAKGRA